VRAGQASPGLLGGRRPGRAGAAQWLEDAALVEQLFVMDGALRVRDVLRQASDAAGAPLEVTGFLRLQARARPRPARGAGAAERARRAAACLQCVAWDAPDVGARPHTLSWCTGAQPEAVSLSSVPAVRCRRQ
jgi:hypothetical protein